MALEERTPLTQLPGIGPAKGRALARLGLERLGDLLEHFPQRYEDRRQCWTIRQAPLEQPCCVSALVAESPRLARIRKGLELVKVRAVDHTGVLHLTFFNQAYLKNALSPGGTYVFYGRVEELGRARTMANPVFEREGEGRYTGLIMPVYPLTAGVSNHLMAGLARRAVEVCAPEREEILPEPLRLTYGLCQVEYAYRNIHFPKDFEALELARRRLVFEELLVLTCGMALLKERRGQGAGRVLDRGRVEDFLSLLPFSPTGAQRRAMEDMAADLASGRAMNRLVQGDVGSGKTAVAAFGAWKCAQNGCQCALMAPTELLAEQHARTLDGLLSPVGGAGGPAHRISEGGGKKDAADRHSGGRGGCGGRHPCPVFPGSGVRRPGSGHRRRAAPLRRGPAGGLGRQRGHAGGAFRSGRPGGCRSDPHAGHVRHPHPPDSGSHHLWGLGRVRDGRAAAGTQSSGHLCGGRG